MSQRATIKLYDENSYTREFTALVQDCTKSGDFFKVELDKTAFFPEGGGQVADPGTLNGQEVFDVQIENDTIYHYVKEPIEVGSTVTGVIDWETRFSRMQNHTGEHIVSGIIHEKYGYDNIGFHLGANDITCDYNGSFTWEEIKEIEKLANKAVFENRVIKTWYPEDLSGLTYRAKLDLTEGVRLVEIEGVDLCACCAPHVKNTAEVGLIKIINFEKAHGGTRLHLRCGALALLDYDEKQDQVQKICDLLSARQYEVANCVEDLQKSNSHLNFMLSRMSEKLAFAKLDSIKPCDGNLVVFLEGADKDALLALANGGREKAKGLFVALTESENGYRYMITSRENNLSSKAKEINEALNGRGGGKDNMIQGTFNASLEEIKQYFE